MEAKPPDEVLSVRDVTLKFGGIAALDGVSLRLEAGLIYGLIGPNGAGKTSLFNCISRIYGVASGDISFMGRSILGLPAHQICALGIARTFQHTALCPGLTIKQNVMLGGHVRIPGNMLQNLLCMRSLREEEARLSERADRLLELLSLQAVASRSVQGLPFGQLKRIELARALAGAPRLLLLDEPAGGLNHHEVDELIELIRKIRALFDITVLIVEHHMNMVMTISDRVIALCFGKKIAEGRPTEVQNDPEVVNAYLGR